MKLNSDQLQAFFQVAHSRSFSKASKSLGLSQPALSIRIKKLEDSLKTSLFLRETSGVSLTEVGEKLFLHCQFMSDHEKEFLSDIYLGSGSQAPLAGLIRVAGFSTVVDSVIIPSLSQLIRKQSEIQIEVITLEIHELNRSLKKSEADFVITSDSLESGHIESILIGYENNVVVEALHISEEKKSIYLDNDNEDQATFEFFKAQGTKPPKYKRWFVDNAPSILTGVEQGWGRAVHPLHIVHGNKKLKVVSDYKTVSTPVYLSFYKRPFYSKLHLAVRDELIKEFKLRLARQRK